MACDSCQKSLDGGLLEAPGCVGGARRSGEGAVETAQIQNAKWQFRYALVHDHRITYTSSSVRACCLIRNSSFSFQILISTIHTAIVAVLSPSFRYYRTTDGAFIVGRLMSSYDSKLHLDSGLRKAR